MTRLQVADLRRQVRRRWPEILTALGMPDASLTKTNKPCPACGGADRFSFTDKDGSGSFVCRALGRQGGDGFQLVMHWLACDFPTALEAVARVLGEQPAPYRAAPSLARTPPASARRDRAHALRECWREAAPLTCEDPSGSYLARRGLLLAAYPPVLRHHSALVYWHVRDGQSPVRLGSHPAMLAAVQGTDGRVVGLHRTYLTTGGEKAVIPDPSTGKPLPVKKLMTREEGVMPGAAIRLYPIQEGRLAVAEGIETALAVRQSCGLPTWACVSANGLSAVILPPEAQIVLIAADNDRNGAGQRAAHALAKRLEQEGRRAEVIVPSLPGMDWLDVLKAERGPAS